MIQSFANSVQSAMKNPFGVDFEVHGKEKNIYVPLGSFINLIGYVDQLDQLVGITRFAIGVLVLAKSSDTKERTIAALHIIRGALETMGNYELYLLALDTVFTVYNIATRLFPANQQPAQPTT